MEEFLLDRAKKVGIEKGVNQAEQQKRMFVARLLTKTSFSTDQITDIADVSVAFVDQIRKDMAS